MGRAIPVGLSAKVRVPASSANLGSGFDSLAVALSVYDEVEARVEPSGLSIVVTGEDAETLACDEGHLVVRAIRRGLAARGFEAPGLALWCQNAIPHARGLGSSAAAAVAGLAIAQVLVAKAEGGSLDRPGLLDLPGLVQLASEFEGHPDNAAASVLGGAVVAWTEGQSQSQSRPSAVETQYCAAKITVSSQVQPVVFVPTSRGMTHVSRGLLPTLVTREDAVRNLSRSALMVLALTADPALLFPASADWLHQPHRAVDQPQSTELVRELRGVGVAAMVSGAGPAVLALVSTESQRAACAQVGRYLGEDWEIVAATFAEGVRVF